MKTIKTDIIPKASYFIDVEAPHEMDLKAICCFVATGFFLDTDTYWTDKKVLTPGTVNTLDGANRLQASKPWFQWHASPRDLSFDEALDTFSELFETIVTEQTQGKSVILPLSGGLDSRTQAVALRNHPHIQTYSYDFKNGYPETEIAGRIAASLEFPFKKFQVQSGYLWDCIEDLADINQCYSEFTHPRQMAFVEQLKGMGEVFSLGHMGDLLFDTMHVPQLSQEDEVQVILNKFIKKAGLELANSLWESWGLEGSFKAYFETRIAKLVSKIDIKDTNAKLRAFKTMYSVTRWSSNNLSVFESVAPIALPYYDTRMCEFVCSLPEHYLSGRQLQIAYIKRHAPQLAKITWQAQKPFHLNNFNLNKVPYNVPYRLVNKASRTFKGAIGKPYISRNWELQFLGQENDTSLKKWLFESGLETLVPKHIIAQFYTHFKTGDTVAYAHAVSMLLTLSLFNKKFNK